MIRAVIDPGVFVSALIGHSGSPPEDDDHLVALALKSRVDAIVSGERDLLEAGLTNPPVWTPRHLAEHIPT